MDYHTYQITEKFCEFAELQNTLAETHPTLRESKEIWSVLNNITNDDWLDLFEVLTTLHSYDNALFSKANVDAMIKGISLLQNYKNHHHRVLDKKGNKKTAWQCFMAIREVYNRVAQPVKHIKPHLVVV